MFDDLKSVLNSAVPFGARGEDNIVGMINTGANVVIVVVLGVSFITLAISFIKMSLSWGDPKSAQEAYVSIVWSGISFIIALLAFVLKAIILGKIIGAIGIM